MAVAGRAHERLTPAIVLQRWVAQTFQVAVALVVVWFGHCIPFTTRIATAGLR